MTKRTFLILFASTMARVMEFRLDDCELQSWYRYASNPKNSGGIFQLWAEWCKCYGHDIPTDDLEEVTGETE